MQPLEKLNFALYVAVNAAALYEAVNDIENPSLKVWSWYAQYHTEFPTAILCYQCM